MGIEPPTEVQVAEVLRGLSRTQGDAHVEDSSSNTGLIAEGNTSPIDPVVGEAIARAMKGRGGHLNLRLAQDLLKQDPQLVARLEQAGWAGVNQFVNSDRF